jgi:uncharacterized protein YdaU (DUF1376 family)
MAKLPFMKFYPNDWLADTGALDPVSKSVWIDVICHMWAAPKRGELTGRSSDLARLLRLTGDELREVLATLERTGLWLLDCPQFWTK